MGEAGEDSGIARDGTVSGDGPGGVRPGEGKGPKKFGGDSVGPKRPKGPGLEFNEGQTKKPQGSKLTVGDLGWVDQGEPVAPTEFIQKTVKPKFNKGDAGKPKGNDVVGGDPEVAGRDDGRCPKKGDDGKKDPGLKDKKNPPNQVPIKKNESTSDIPKKGWMELGKALGFMITNPDDLKLIKQNADQIDPQNPGKIDPNIPSKIDPKPKNYPTKKWTDYNIQGSWSIDGNEIPFNIENLQVDKSGIIKPTKGNSTLLGPYTTAGTMDFDNNVLNIERKFDTGILFAGSGVIDPKNNFTKGNWKMNVEDPKVKDQIEGVIGTELGGKKKLMGKFIANSNNDEVYPGYRPGRDGSDPEGLTPGVVDPEKPRVGREDPGRSGKDPRFKPGESKGPDGQTPSGGDPD